jgi:hypothetical protein
VCPRGAARRGAPAPRTWSESPPRPDPGQRGSALGEQAGDDGGSLGEAPRIDDGRLWRPDDSDHGRHVVGSDELDGKRVGGDLTHRCCRWQPLEAREPEDGHERVDREAPRQEEQDKPHAARLEAR